MEPEPRPEPYDPHTLLEHAAWVRALARRLVKDAGAAEDVAQETWLAALRTPPPAGRSVKAWLASVVRHRALHHGRGAARRGALERGTAHAESLPSDDELTHRLELQQWVVGHVQALPAEYRRVLLLRYYEGRSAADIAKYTDTPLETVKTHLKRALARLRERMERDDGPRRERGLAALLPLVEPHSAALAWTLGGVMMSTKSVSIAFGIVALLWLAFATPWDTRPAASPGVAEPPRTGALRSPVAAAGARPDALATTDSEDTTRREVLAPPAESIRIRAVDRLSGAPVPGALITIVEYERVKDDWDGRQRGGSQWDPERALAELAEPRAADEHGYVEVPLADDSLAVVARHGELYGELAFRPRAGVEESVALGVDRQVTLQSVDPEGRPVAGVPVGISVQRSPSGDRIAWWANTSGPTATATLYHVDDVLPVYLGEQWSWCATLAGPDRDRPRVLLDSAQLPVGPVQVRVPPGGRVIVRLEDSAGAAPDVDTIIFLGGQGARPGETGPVTHWMSHTRFTREATYDHVGLGLVLRAYASWPGMPHTEFVGPGPTRAGEVVVITLRHTRPLPILAGQAIDADGKHVRVRIIDVFVHFDDGDRIRTEHHGTRTDPWGRFDVPISSGGPDSWLGLEFGLAGARGVRAQRATRAAWPSTPSAETGIVDLGEVHLTRADPIAAGRVVDDLGQPLSNVRVVVQVSVPGSLPYQHPTEPLPALTTTTFEDGSFEITGERVEGYLSMTFEKRDHLSLELVPLPPDATPRTFVLTRACTLTGHVLLPEGVDPERVALDLYVREERDARDQRDLVPLLQDGSFYAMGLAPGLVDIDVLVPGWGPDHPTVRDVLLTGGEPTTDPRLDPLDLRESLPRDR